MEFCVMPLQNVVSIVIVTFTPCYSNRTLDIRGLCILASSTQSLNANTTTMRTEGRLGRHFTFWTNTLRQHLPLQCFALKVPSVLYKLYAWLIEEHGYHKCFYSENYYYWWNSGPWVGAILVYYIPAVKREIFLILPPWTIYHSDIVHIEKNLSVLQTTPWHIPKQPKSKIFWCVIL